MKDIPIIWSMFALDCLTEIQNYIFEKTKSDKVALNYVNKIFNSVDQLKNFPESGQEENFLKDMKARYLIVDSYKVIYYYQNNRILITDIFHTKQNPIKIIKREKQ